ncbi:hypothetical protein INT47_006854 [Mucor saturninus]|uniref:Uncharacterized protein n=1 Tax=Mucor saturninus TaxID=64648 RepID=A0A8H7RAH6_9FUNG|nr:hypothetical protein INT47_006854 [Mucor saturninus]
MQNRITKTCQVKKSKRADRLRDLLQLSASDSILLDACARKPLNEVKELLEALPGINPDTIRDRYLRTPLHLACSRKDDPLEATSIAKLLIRSGADVNNGVGDVDGLQPMHMGANIPASDPFRLTPLLLAKLKLDNLRQVQETIHHAQVDWVSESAKDEYQDLKSITQVLVSHLANKHITSFGLPSYDTSGYYGLSDFLFLKESDDLDETISLITDKLATIGMTDENIQQSVNGLIEKVKKLGIK